MKKVSLIVPIYNTQDYLRKCLNSLVEQSYKNIEIILVDDGSTDNSYAICKEYDIKFEQIKLFQKQNGGVSDTRNYGISKATGEFISFVDSDDYLEKDFVEILVNLIKKYDAEISISLKEGHLLNNNEVHVFNGSVMLMHILNNSCFEVWGKLYKRELISEALFPVNKIHEDLYVIPGIFLKSKKCVIVHKGLYHYQIRENSIMGMVNKTHLKDISQCCLNNIRKSENSSVRKKFKLEYQKWYFYHILWYYYEIVCNMEKKKSKKSLRNIASFYKKTCSNYWINPYVKISDKFRFTLIAIAPKIIRDYSVFAYQLNQKRNNT